MVYRDSKEILFKEGLIKKCPLDYTAIMNLMKRAFIDLKTASRNIDEDAECAYNYAYNAILRSGLALMFSEGFRPEIRDKHLTVVRFVTIILGDKFKTPVNNYDFMRRKRHRFIYEPDIPCSKEEAKNALKTAKELADVIRKFIMKNNPQLEFDFNET